MEQQKQPNNKSDWVTVAWLVLFFPVGLIKMWRSQQFPILAKVTITTLFAAIPIVSHNQGLQVHSENQMTDMPSRSVASIAPDLVERERSYLEKRLKEVKYPGRNDLHVKVIRWNGFYLLSCTIGLGGNCGIYEVVKTENETRTYWVNGNAAGGMDKFLQKSPNAGTKYDISGAYRIATQKE